MSCRAPWDLIRASEDRIGQKLLIRDNKGPSCPPGPAAGQTIPPPADPRGIKIRRSLRKSHG